MKPVLDQKMEMKFDYRLSALVQDMAQAGMRRAAQGLSSMVGETLTVTEPTIQVVPITQITELIGGPENEAVGIYLRAEHKLSGQIMMIMPYPKALELVDLLMQAPLGTTKNLGSIERSALAELGNLTGSFFINAVADLTGLEGRPSPPAVVVDMVGAILNILLASWDGISENVLLIKTNFLRDGHETQASFWVIPDSAMLQAVSARESAENAE
jgi:chemotaxis protein CheC